MNLQPLFEDGAGTRSANPLALAGPVPVVDLSVLALLLAPPAMLGEFAPAAPWRGIRRISYTPPSAHADRLPDAFTAAVVEQTKDVETVGVLVSGGLDSLAVLDHALRAAEGRRVIALTTNLVDDTGRSAAEVVRALLYDLDLSAELVVLDPAQDRAEPVWSPVGPRLDALPEVNAASAARAVDLGAGVLLSGDGADELLGVPRFATAAVARRHGLKAAGRYAADVASSGPGLPGELAALAARLLSRKARARAYWAANWTAWADPVAPAVLAEPYRQLATDWGRRWVDARVAGHTEAGRSWSEADAYDAVFPREAIPPSGFLPEGSPFLTERFLAAALALPVGDRYDPGLRTAYQRCKAQVVRLLPHRALDVLPMRKQYFATALARQATTGRQGPVCVEAGLIDGPALAMETDPAVLLVVAALEHWLTGALHHGAAIG